MPQFRFRGINPAGKIVQSEFEAESKKTAKARINKIVRKNGIKVKALDKKEKFLYKVKKNGSQVIQGEQEAYSKEEVEKALAKLGYKIVRVEKELLSFNLGVPTKEVVAFIRLSADLLKQHLSFDQILDLLYEDTTNKQMKATIKQIQKDLKEGKDGREVYGKHQKVFGKFASYMLGVASSSGNMAEVFESTAKFLERNAEFKKNLRKSLMMPAITVLAVFGVILFYVGYIFPKTAEMFLKMHIKLPPMTAETLKISHFLQNNWIIITLSFLTPIAAFIAFVKTPRGRLWLDKWLIRLPLVGDLIHKMSIEIFSRVFYTLYTGSGQNIEVIRVAAEACRNSYMEQQIKMVAIKNMLKNGIGLVKALEKTGVFTHTALSRFKLGAESGALRENSKQLADYYEIQTRYKLDATVDMINLFVNIFIMVALIGITVVSSETAVIQPPAPGM